MTDQEMSNGRLSDGEIDIDGIIEFVGYRNVRISETAIDNVIKMYPHDSKIKTRGKYIQDMFGKESYIQIGTGGDITESNPFSNYIAGYWTYLKNNNILNIKDSINESANQFTLYNTAEYTLAIVKGVEQEKAKRDSEKNDNIALQHLDNTGGEYPNLPRKKLISIDYLSLRDSIVSNALNSLQQYIKPDKVDSFRKSIEDNLGEPEENFENEFYSTEGYNNVINWGNSIVSSIIDALEYIDRRVYVNKGKNNAGILVGELWNSWVEVIKYPNTKMSFKDVRKSEQRRVFIDTIMESDDFQYIQQILREKERLESGDTDLKDLMSENPELYHYFKLKLDLDKSYKSAYLQPNQGRYWRSVINYLRNKSLNDTIKSVNFSELLFEDLVRIELANYTVDDARNILKDRMKHLIDMFRTYDEPKQIELNLSQRLREDKYSDHNIIFNEEEISEIFAQRELPIINEDLVEEPLLPALIAENASITDILALKPDQVELLERLENDGYANLKMADSPTIQSIIELLAKALKQQKDIDE